MPTLYLANYVASMTSPVIHDGFVLVHRDRIEAVGELRYLPRVSARRVHLGRVLVTPGLINAHAHSNLSCLAGQFSPMPLWDWLCELTNRRRTLRSREGGEANELTGVVPAVQAALSRGTTTLADMHFLPAVREAVMQLPIRQIACCEYLSVAPHLDAEAWIPDCVGPRWRGARSLPALAPHASYSVQRRWLEAAVQAANKYDVPLVTHWAESGEETAWLAGQANPIADLMGQWGVDRLMPESPHLSAGEYAREVGLLHAGAMLVHGNALTEADIVLLASFCEPGTVNPDSEVTDAGTNRTVSVCYCPRAHRFFGHPPHPWLKLLEAGVNVCVGTDSLAGLPPGATLSPMEELRFLRREFPDVDPFTLWRLATANAADALRLRGHLGVLEPGAQADFALWPISNETTPDTVLADVLDSDVLPCGVYIAGERIAGGEGK